MSIVDDDLAISSNAKFACNKFRMRTEQEYQHPYRSSPLSVFLDRRLTASSSERFRIRHHVLQSQCILLVSNLVDAPEASSALDAFAILELLQRIPLNVWHEPSSIDDSQIAVFIGR